MSSIGCSYPKFTISCKAIKIMSRVVQWNDGENMDKQTVEGKSSVKNGVRRLFFVVLAIILEIVFVLVIAVWFNNYANWITTVTHLAALALVLLIYSQHRSASIKMPWIMLIMAMPLLGVVLYVLIGLNAYTGAMKRRYEEIDRQLLPRLIHSDEHRAELKEKDPAYSKLSEYLDHYSGYPLYKNTDVRYYSEAYMGLDAQVADMRKAKDFIFMEYHAIEDAEAFHRIEEVLVKKVKEGVEVRIFYDDVGSIGFITTDFVKRMEEKGIRCRVFNPFLPGLNMFLNNRDHRKITVIDGRVAFTGGYNLANEYFNLTHPYGYWKDTGIRLEGDAVRSLTITFLEMWNAIKGNDINDENYEQYLKKYDYRAKGDGFVQPYADLPLDKEHVGENVYANMASGAKNYVYYVTPYLIITDEMNYTLGLAAKSGVDVRIITPGIPDKKTIYALTRSYYAQLVQSGVRIYEYSPGFCHCKMSVADDRTATCGTINLDYRSLYHHFENGCVIYHDPSVMEIKKDFEDMLSQSREVTERYRSGRSRFMRMGQLILRLFAPLL